MVHLLILNIRVADSEPKWVLKKLMDMLARDLEARAERHIKRDLGHVPDGHSIDEKVEASSSSAS